jgi:hypothetical protein
LISFPCPSFCPYSFLPVTNVIAIATIHHSLPLSLPAIAAALFAAALGRSVAAATEHIPRSLHNEAAAAVVITQGMFAYSLVFLFFLVSSAEVKSFFCFLFLFCFLLL